MRHRTQSAITISLLLLLIGCSRTLAPDPARPPVGSARPPAESAPPPARPRIPAIDELSAATLMTDSESPHLRVAYSDQRAVIVRVLEMLQAAEPVPEPATRYAGDSPVLQLYFQAGGGVAVAPAFECATDPTGSAPRDCRPVEGEVTYFPPADAPPVRLRSPDLARWLTGGWKENWPVAAAPERVDIDIVVRDGTTQALPTVRGAEITFESEAGARYQVRTDAGGAAALTLPAIPVMGADGTKRCTAYRVTVSAPTFKTEVVDRMYISPWAGKVYFHPSMVKGEGTWRTSETGEKCLPDQQPF